MIHIIHNIYDNIDNKNDVCAVYLDILKAFDKVYHKGLIFKLKQIGVTGNLLMLIESYLTNRRQQVVLNGVSSDTKYINAGVPQGSILGPLFFLIYINDIVENITSSIYLYADDTSLIQPINPQQPVVTFDQLNDDLNKLYLWSLQWRVSFNASKTKYIIFTNKKNRVVYPQLYFGGNMLQQVTEYKHLGVDFSEDLSWNTYIDKVCSKTSKRVDCLKRLKFVLPRQVLCRIYSTMILPLMEYACIVIDNMSVSNKNKLESVQRSAALCCTGAFVNTSTNRLMDDLGWNTLEQRRTFFRLCHLYKVVNNLVPEYLKNQIQFNDLMNANYNLRNILEIKEFRCRLTLMYDSFFPKTVREWNALESEVRNAGTLNNFRQKLFIKLNFRKSNELYNSGNGFVAIMHTRMRLGLSHLRQHLYDYKIIDNAICQYCSLESEDTAHYFLRCPSFAIPRMKLLCNILNIIPFGIIPTLTDNKIIGLLLNHQNDIDNILQLKLFELSKKYIYETNRFKIT